MFSSSKNNCWRPVLNWVFGLVLFTVVGFYGGRAIFVNTRGPVKLVVYAFSTQEEVLTQAIFPAFEQTWENGTGRDLTIEGVFGPSGILAGQINLGAPADLALFSNKHHVNWLKVGRQVKWETRPVVVSQTPVVIVTRSGNPAGIADFGDLARPSLRLLQADPRNSGAGAWAVLAEYGSALLETGNAASARAQLKDICHNVHRLGPSARATLTLFELGAGDALVTYEQDARLALAREVPLEILVPPRTIIVKHVVVIVDSNVTPAERPVAQAFINFLLSDTGQQIFARYHLRPATIDCNAFPPLTQPFTVEALAGWSRAFPELVEDIWQLEIDPRLNLEPAAPELLHIGFVPNFPALAWVAGRCGSITEGHGRIPPHPPDLPQIPTAAQLAGRHWEIWGTPLNIISEAKDIRLTLIQFLQHQMPANYVCQHSERSIWQRLGVCCANGFI